jgi:rhamnosyltransferase
MAGKRFKNKNPADCQHVWAVVVTYNVGQAFAHRIKTYLHQVEKVVLVDNSTEAMSRAIVSTIAGALSEKVVLIANTENQGLARAQNQGIGHALSAGADWVLLLDDDSEAAQGMLSHMKEALADYMHPERIGLLAPVVWDTNTGKPQPFMARLGPLFFRRKKLISEGHMLDDVLAVISSGSLIRREVFEEIGLMREDFFIDYVDTEFCLRALSHRWFILAAGGARLNHTLGAKTSHKLLGMKHVASNHPAGRRYTIYRNRACMWKAYAFTVPGYVLYDMMAAPYDILRILCFEEERRLKLKSVLRGLRAGLFGLRRSPKEGFPRL